MMLLTRYTGRGQAWRKTKKAYRTDHETDHYRSLFGLPPCATRCHPPTPPPQHARTHELSFRSIPGAFRLDEGFRSSNMPHCATADGIAHCNASMGLCPHMQLDCAFQTNWFIYTGKLNRSSDQTWPKAEFKGESHLAGAFFHLLAPLLNWLSSSLLKHFKAYSGSTTKKSCPLSKPLRG